MKNFLLTFIAVMSICTATYAANVNVQLNGELIDFTDAAGNKVEAQTVNSRTMVPLRKIFELLGAEVGWDSETRTALASKGDTKIKLQINNEIAEITKGGETKQIKLDSKPILIDNRTMVPLRFISESLDKQVGWDAKNQTAIIIDYDYFANRLKDKAPALYNAITSRANNSVIQITREYSDLKNSANNKNATVYASISNPSVNKKSILVDFAGNEELFEEIKNEAWATIALDVNFDKNGLTYSTPTAALSKMLTQNSNTYEELGLTGCYDDTLSEAIKNMIGIDENLLNVLTFENVKNEYEKFLDLFTYSNVVGSSTMKTNKINYENANNQYIDFTKFDNIIFENEFSQVYNVINKLIFNYDINLDELLYDVPNINAEITATHLAEGGSSVSIKLTLLNDFDEKVTYNIKVNKN